MVSFSIRKLDLFQRNGFHILLTTGVMAMILMLYGMMKKLQDAKRKLWMF